MDNSSGEGGDKGGGWWTDSDLLARLFRYRGGMCEEPFEVMIGHLCIVSAPMRVRRDIDAEDMLLASVASDLRTASPTVEPLGPGQVDPETLQRTLEEEAAQDRDSDARMVPLTGEIEEKRGDGGVVEEEKHGEGETGHRERSTPWVAARSKKSVSSICVLMVVDMRARAEFSKGVDFNREDLPVRVHLGRLHAAAAALCGALKAEEERIGYVSSQVHQQWGFLETMAVEEEELRKQLGLAEAAMSPRRDDGKGRGVVGRSVEEEGEGGGGGEDGGGRASGSGGGEKGEEVAGEVDIATKRKVAEVSEEEKREFLDDIGSWRFKRLSRLGQELVLVVEELRRIGSCSVDINGWLPLSLGPVSQPRLHLRSDVYASASSDPDGVGILSPPAVTTTTATTTSTSTTHTPTTTTSSSTSSSFPHAHISHPHHTTPSPSSFMAQSAAIAQTTSLRPLSHTDSLLLLEPPEVVTKRLPPDAPPILRRFIVALHPGCSLQDACASLHVPLSLGATLAAHLVSTGSARPMQLLAWDTKLRPSPLYGSVSGEEATPLIEEFESIVDYAIQVAKKEVDIEADRSKSKKARVGKAKKQRRKSKEGVPYSDARRAGEGEGEGEGDEEVEEEGEEVEEEEEQGGKVVGMAESLGGEETEGRSVLSGPVSDLHLPHGSPMLGGKKGIRGIGGTQASLHRSSVKMMRHSKKVGGRKKSETLRSTEEIERIELAEFLAIWNDVPTLTEAASRLPLGPKHGIVDLVTWGLARGILQEILPYPYLLLPVPPSPPPSGAVPGFSPLNAAERALLSEEILRGSKAASTSSVELQQALTLAPWMRGALSVADIAAWTGSSIQEVSATLSLFEKKGLATTLYLCPQEHATTKPENVPWSITSK